MWSSPNAKERFTIREWSATKLPFTSGSTKKVRKRSLYGFAAVIHVSVWFTCTRITLTSFSIAFQTGERVRISSRFHRSLIQHRQCHLCQCRARTWTRNLTLAIAEVYNRSFHLQPEIEESVCLFNLEISLFSPSFDSKEHWRMASHGESLIDRSRHHERGMRCGSFQLSLPPVVVTARDHWKRKIVLEKEKKILPN